LSLYSGAGPLPEDISTATKLVKDSVNKLIDNISGYGVSRSGNERMSAFLAKQQGWAAPRHVSAAETTGNKLIHHAAASEAAPEYARALASSVLGEQHFKDAAFDVRLGKTLVENRLRALAETHAKKGEQELADRVTHVLSEQEYRANLSNPEIKAALERHKAPGSVQEVAQKQHTALGGTLAAKGENSLFANLTAISHAKTFEGAQAWVYGKGNVNTQAILRGSKFEHKALGVAEDYVTSYKEIAKRMIEGNYKRNTLRDWLDQGVKDGVYKWAKRGEDTPIMGGQPMVRIPVEVKATPWGSKAIKDIWIRKDLAPEVEQALNGGGRVAKAGAQLLLDLATEAQIIGPTDFVFHTANMYASVVGSLGAKSFGGDLARKITGVKHLDAVGRIGYNLYRSLIDSPEVQAELADLARIGAMRPISQHPSLLGKVTKGYLDTGKWIRAIDRAGRLARNQLFDNLVERKLVENNELNRREFVNKMGQYNAKLMSKFQDTMQKYTSQFVVAGRTFNRNAFQRLLMSNEVRAASPEAYAKMKLLNMVGLVTTLLVIPIVVNSILGGNPWGRLGTPIGMIDTGKDNAEGKPIYIDPAQTELLRRGLRVSGMESLIKGVRAEEAPGKVAGKMTRDIIMGQLHPWAGPPVRIVQTYIEKGAETRDPVEALKAAMAAVNPSVTAYFEKNPEGDKKGLGGVVGSLAGSIGVKTGSPLTHQQRVDEVAVKKGIYGANVVPKYQQRREAEKAYHEVRPALSREDVTKAAQNSIRNNAVRGEALQESMPSEVKSWLKKNQLKLPAHANRIVDNGVSITLTADELTQYETFLREWDQVEIKYLDHPWFDKLPQRKKEELFSSVIANASRIAKMKTLQLIKEQKK
jgi:hypothetical protein